MRVQMASLQRAKEVSVSRPRGACEKPRRAGALHLSGRRRCPEGTRVAPTDTFRPFQVFTGWKAGGLRAFSRPERTQFSPATDQSFSCFISTNTGTRIESEPTLSPCVLGSLVFNPTGAQQVRRLLGHDGRWQGGAEARGFLGV